MTRLALALALAFLGACSFWSFSPWPKHGKAPLPSRRDDYSTDGTPRSAIASDTAFDARFRSNVRDYGYAAGVHGVDELRYPETNHPDAAFAYVRLGNALLAKNDRGGAAQAYWAALGLTSRTFGSRLQREQIRAAAYGGLARVAEAKQQAEWAALLRLCAGLATTYTQSDDAEEAHGDLYAALGRQERAQRDAEAAQARASRAMMWQSIALGVGAASTVVRGGLGQISNEQVNAEAAQLGQQFGALEQQQFELSTAMTETMAAIASSVGQLREVTAADIPAIQAGRSFIARQVGWYLLAAKNPQPYLVGPLADYVRGRPPLRPLVEAARTALLGSDQDVRDHALADLALGFLAVERHVAMHERHHLVPSADYVRRVCASDGGAIECFLSAGDICRAGVEEGCATLDALARGGQP